MKTYKVIVYTEMTVDEYNYKAYIEEQDYKWSIDNPKQVKSLKEKGYCKFEDEVGHTTVSIHEQ